MLSQCPTHVFVARLTILYLIWLSLFSTTAYSDTKLNTRHDLLAELTPSEIKWLNQKQTITYTGHPNFLPLEAFDHMGNHIGMAAEYIKALEEITGLTFKKIETINLDESFSLTENGNIDIIAGDAKNPKLNKRFSPLPAYSTNDAAIVMRKGEPSVTDLQQITDSTIAYIEGYDYHQHFQKKYPSIAFIAYEDIRSGLDAVSNNSIDALLAPRATAAYSMTIGAYNDLKIVGTSPIIFQSTFFVNNNQPILYSLLNKSLPLISSHQRMSIASRWSIPAKQNTEGLFIHLTRTEREYLKRISPITFTGDPDWLPYEAFDKNGNYIGQVADHLEIIQVLLGIEFNIIPTQSWAESVDLMREKKIDVLSETDKSVLGNNVLYTTSYSSSPVVIVMRETETYVENLQHIKNKKIAIIKDYGNTVEILEKHPNIPFLSVDTVQEGLIAVSTGEIDGMLINAAQAIFHIKQIGLNNIRIVGKTDVETRLAFAINSEKAALIAIFNKALLAIINSPQQQAIYDKWNSVKYSEKVDYVIAYRILAIALTVIFFIFLWSKRLKLDIERREKAALELSIAKEQAHKANQSKTRFLAMVSHEIRTPLNGILGMLELLEHSTLNGEQRNMTSIAKKSSENIQEILNDILDISKIEANKIDLTIQEGNLLEIIESCLNTHLQTAYNKSLSISTNIDPVLARPLMIDSIRVRQIINNFISNAIKFTDNGSISITATSKANQDTHEFSVSVKDTGMGISIADQNQLFDEFSNINKPEQHQLDSHGLGLFISKKLGDLMGGEIRVKSQLHHGTEICYTQTVLHSNKNKETLCWKGYNFAILSNDIATKKIIEKHAGYLGANIFTPAIIIQDINWLTALASKKNIDILFIDKNQPLLKNHSLSKQNFTRPIRIIYLSKKYHLNSNHMGNFISSLNTNPIKLSFLYSLINNLLGKNISFTQKKVNITKKIKKALHLLVVEDHPTNQILISQQLDYLGYHYTLASNGQEAIKKLEHNKYDGILTDCQMPLINGYELAKHVRNIEGENIPIIAMTANTLNDEKTKCLRSGMNDLLIKPLALHMLSHCLDQWVAGNSKSVSNTEQHLQTLSHAFMGIENIPSILGAYHTSTEKDLNELHLAAKSNQKIKIKKIAHRMIGAAKTVLADELSESLEQLHQSCTNLDIDEINQRIEVINQLYVHYKQQWHMDIQEERSYERY